MRVRAGERIRVLLVEDHLLVRQGLRKVLEADPEIEVVDDVSDGESAIDASFRLQPNVIVIDIGLPGINGIEAASRIQRGMGNVAILMLSMHGDEFYVRRSLKAGAKGYVLKDAEEMEIVRAVKAVARGDSYVSPALHPLLLSGYLASQQRVRA
jgi:DNA-binding NarL/FixJ family response regulator